MAIVLVIQESKNNMYKLDRVTKEVKDGTNSKIILNDISLEIQEGEFIGVSGESGAGKSTLLHILGGLDTISSGILTFDSGNVSKMDDNRMSILRRKIGFVFQSAYLIDHLNVLDNVLMPLKINNKNTKKMRERAIECLVRVKMADDINSPSLLGYGKNLKLSQLPRTLSGGEKQRVAVARAIVTNPSVILADEPTGSLDKENEEIVFNLLQEINEKDGITVVLVSHNQDLINKCSRIINIKDGKIVNSSN